MMTASTNKHHTGPQRKRTTKEHLEKIHRERYVSRSFQIQLEEDGVGSTGQSWIEKSGLWLVPQRVEVKSAKCRHGCICLLQTHSDV